MTVKSDLSALKKLQNNLESLGQTQQVPLKELMNVEFMRKHTSYGSVQEMFDASGFKIESAEDFKAIPDDEWEFFIIRSTKFSSWREMQVIAAKDWMAKKLFEGIR